VQGISLTSWGTVSFLRRTVLRGVNWLHQIEENLFLIDIMRLSVGQLISSAGCMTKE